MNKQFPFPKDQFRIEYVGLLTLSKATIDPPIKYEDANGLQHRVVIPTSIARLIRSRLHDVTRFAVAYPACIAFVGDRVVAVDVATKKDLQMYEETGEWISCIEKQEGLIDQIHDDWSWDGQYAYTYDGEVNQIGESNYGYQKCKTWNLYRLGEDKADPSEQMAALCYRHPETQEWVKTGPLTRQLGGKIQLTGDQTTFGKSEFVDVDSSVDEVARLDFFKFVNIRFVNYAARVLANRFGYEAIEPLGLPLLMIEHRTFNIGGLTMPVQISSSAPLKFSQALAWLIGFHMKVDSLEDVIAIKQTFKMLLTKGNTLTMSTEEIRAKTKTTTKGMIAELRARMETADLIEFSAP